MNATGEAPDRATNKRLELGSPHGNDKPLMPQPPLLPEAILARVHRLAMLDGMGVVFFAGIYAIGSAADGIAMAAVIGLLGAAAGAMELHGAGLLRYGQPRGVSWLVASQPLLLGVIWAYCVYRLYYNVEIPPIPEFLEDAVRRASEQMAMSEAEYASFSYRTTYQVLAILSFFYQGGMTYYYFTRRHAVSRALGEE